jgi:hypothetical protein
MTHRLVSKPTWAQLKRDFWRPSERRLFVRKAWGRGWTINFARIVRGGARR